MRPDPTRRRKSIFLGLVLMLIGVLFLIHNLQPSLVHLGEILLYWPILLILWGLALLWDHFAARRANQTAPRSVGRAEFLLIIFVVAASVSLLAFNRFQTNAERRYRYYLLGIPYTFTSAVTPAPVKPFSQVLLWTPRGNITVRPHHSMTLGVVVKKTVRAINSGSAQRMADATEVAVASTPQGIRVEPQFPPHAFGEMVSYDAFVFPDVSLTLSTGRGDLHIEGIKGPISGNASGDVDISQAGSNVTLNLNHGNLRIQSVAGNVTVSGRGQQVDLSEITGLAILNGRFFGPIRVRRAAGGMQIHSRRTTMGVNAALGGLDMTSGRLLLSDTAGNVSLRTRDLDVDIENARGAVHIVNRNGDVEVHCYQDPRNGIDIFDRSGNISLYLPDHSSFSLAASALSGDIANGFPAPTVHLVRRSSNSYMQGSVGSGGPQITLHTTYGAIRILPAPRVPPSEPTASSQKPN